MQRVLLVDTESGFWKHALTNYQLLKLLEDEFEIIHVTCDGAFKSLCTVRSGKNLDASSDKSQRELICESCKTNNSLIEVKHKSIEIKISDFIDYKTTKNILSKIDSLNTSKKYEYCYQGIPVGRLAVYETIIKYKKTNLQFNAIQKKFYMEKIETALISAKAAIKIMDRFKPEIVIVNNPGYATSGAFSEVAIRKNIKTYHFSNPGVMSEFYSTANLNELKLGSWDIELIPLWNPKKKKISILSAIRTWNYLRFIKKAKSPWIYSRRFTGKNIRNILGIPSTNKIILAAMSSSDEKYAAVMRGLRKSEDNAVFKSQLEWIKDLVEWSKKQRNLTLIIRLHPREFSNKRESVTSSTSAIYLKYLESTPDNIKISSHKDDLSAYDYLSQIDILTTGWSSLGLDALLHNIPVVNYDRNLIMYPETLALTGRSKNEYFNNLANILNGRLEINFETRAKTWFELKYLINPIKLGGGILDRNIAGFSLDNHFFRKVLHNLNQNLVKKIELSIPPASKDKKRIKAILKNNTFSNL